MKIKQRALSILLSLVMVLTFMPAMTFADADEWSASAVESEVYLDASGEATLAVEVVPGEYDGDFYYEWYDEDDELIDSGIDMDSIDVYYYGYFYCVVYDDEDGYYEVEFNVYPYEDPEDPEDPEPEDPDVPYWDAYADEDEVWLDEDTGSATLRVVTDSYGYEEGEGPTLYYWWFYEDSLIEGEDEDSLEVSQAGEYSCYVSENPSDEPEPGVIGFTVYPYGYVPEEDEGLEWEAHDYDYDTDCFLSNGKAVLEVHPDYFGEGTPVFTYQWGTGEGDGFVAIEGATGKSYTATSAGDYTCKVKISVNGVEEESWVSFTVFDWRITNTEDDVYFKYGTAPTLTVTTDYKGTGMTYQWYTWDEDAGEDGNGDYVEIAGATSATYTAGVNEEGDFSCDVTVNGQTQSFCWYTYIDDSDYDYVVRYPNATATYTTGDGRPLTVDFVNYEDFYQDGDSITIKNNGEEKVYTYSGAEEDFVSDDDEWVTLEIVDTDASAGKVEVNVYSNQETDHPNKKHTRDYDIYTTWNAEVITDVASIKFEPSSISLYSEDVKEVDNGHTYYTLVRRGRYKGEDGDEYYSWFVKGDKLTVTPTEGNPIVYTFNAENGLFENGDEFISPEDGDITVSDYSLEQGNNTVTIAYKGRKAKINVFMDTPQLRAERQRQADEAARQGTQVKGMPKMKFKKNTAKKTSIKIQWAKLNKKQLKKSKATHYEIWVSANSTFPKGPQTKEYIVKKSKGSVNVKGLSKNTKYFVKIRAIKYVGGKKQTGPWKQKKVKTKKK